MEDTLAGVAIRAPHHLSSASAGVACAPSGVPFAEQRTANQYSEEEYICAC